MNDTTSPTHTKIEFRSEPSPYKVLQSVVDEIQTGTYAGPAYVAALRYMSESRAEMHMAVAKRLALDASFEATVTHEVKAAEARAEKAETEREELVRALRAVTNPTPVIGMKAAEKRRDSLAFARALLARIEAGK